MRREFRPADQVFAEDALASFHGAAITVGHPPKGVNTSNWRKNTVGHLGEDAKKDGHLTATTVYLDDEGTIQRVLSGELGELSAGYDTTLEMTPGTTESGEHYDAVQTEIRGNHVALLPPGRGRAGPEVRLHLDESDDEETPFLEKQMDIEKVLKALKKDMADVVRAELAKAEEARGRADALEAKNAQLTAELAAATNADAVDARVAARVDLAEKARKLDPEVKTTGSDRDIMLRVLGEKADSTATDDYLRGSFEARVALAGERKTNADAAASLVVPATGGQTVPVESKLDKKESAYNAYMRGAAVPKEAAQ